MKINTTNLNRQTNLTESANSPLIFKSDVNFDLIKNVLLIDSNVQHNQIFFDSSNSMTLPIIYRNDSERIELINYLKMNLTNIDRIGFVFNDSQMNNKMFLNNKLFFTQTDLDGENMEHSENFKFIVDLIDEFKISNIDYLVCNSLNNPNWVKYFDLLNFLTGITIGASDDKTGNIKYGGDWIMESTNEDIKQIYWSDSIENYNQTLVTTVLGTSTTITQNDANNYTWPVTVNGGSINLPTIITIGENLTLSDGTNYFIIDSEYITIDGNNNLISINNVTNYNGLIQNGNLNAFINGKSNVTVQNIGIASTGTTTLNNNYG